MQCNTENTKEHPVSRALHAVEKTLGTWWGMCLAQALPLFVLLYPYIFGWKLFSDGDSQGHNYPAGLFLYTAESAKSGLAFLNTLNFHGFPSWVDESASSAVLAHIINLILPPLQAYGTLLFVNMFTGAVLFSFLLRRYSISAPAAWFGGFVFVTCMWWNVAWASSTMTAPCIAALLLSLSYYDINKKISTLCTVMVLMYAWYSVHWVWLPLFWTSGGIFALYISYECWRKEQKIWGYPIVMYVIMFAISTVIALPKIAPAFLFTHLSFRAGGVDFQSASLGGITLFTYLQAAFPYLSIPHIDFGQALGVYVGLFGYLCAIAAWSKPTKIIKALTVCYVVFFLIALDHSWLYQLLQKVPPFSYIRGEGRWLPVGGIALSALAAIGLDTMIQNSALQIQKRLSNILLWLLVCFLCVAGVAWIIFGIFEKQTMDWLLHIFDTRFFQHTSGLPIEHYHQIIIGYGATIREQTSLWYLPTAFSVLAIFLAALLLAPCIWLKMGKNAGMMLTIISVLTTGILLSFMRTTVTEDVFPWTTNTSEYIHKHPGMAFSVFPNFAKFLLFDPKKPTDAESVIYQAELLVPNRNLRYGVPSIDIFDNMMNRRMGNLLAWVGSEQIMGKNTDNLSKERITPEEKIQKMLARKDVLDILNVQTILSLWPLKHPDLSLAIESEEYLPLQQKIYIYNNETARPQFYFAKNIHIVPKDENRAFEMIKNLQWKNNKSLIECDECTLKTSNGFGVVRIRHQSHTAVDIETESAAPGWLILSINRIPGWVISVDNLPVSTYYANLSFFGVPLEKGKHTISMRFSVNEVLRKSLQWMVSGELE